jgi:hypothetical protein
MGCPFSCVGVARQGHGSLIRTRSGWPALRPAPPAEAGGADSVEGLQKGSSVCQAPVRICSDGLVKAVLGRRRHDQTQRRP